MSKYLQPAVFVPHGGGPMPVLGNEDHAAMIECLTNFHRDVVTTKPDTIVLVTAHWEEEVTTITSAAQPELLYDYGGFPAAAYEIKYPAPGNPALASRIEQLLAKNGIASKLNADRGYDHGVFIPLKLMFPEADVPVVQVSVLTSMDPEAHIKVGEALRELRKDNVLIIGSGLSFHSFKYWFGNRTGGPEARAAARAEGHRLSLDFHEYFTQALIKTTDAQKRRERLIRWATDAPYAREVQPREDHLLPLFVIAGAGLDEPCEEIFADKLMDVHTTGYLFGERS